MFGDERRDVRDSRARRRDPQFGDDQVGELAPLVALRHRRCFARQFGRGFLEYLDECGERFIIRVFLFSLKRSLRRIINC